jgi:hypothetical protein
MKGSSSSSCGEECAAQKSLSKIRELIRNCGWQHVRGCKWCGNVFVEWEGVDCDQCNLFICDECNKKYKSHKMCGDITHYYCRDCAYRCDAEDCDVVSVSKTPEIEHCWKCGFNGCKIHFSEHLCKPK